MRFRYHQPIPNFFKVDNPQNPKRKISSDLLELLEKLVIGDNFTGISYSKLSDDFKEEFNIDFDNVIIFKYLIANDILKMNPSDEKCVLMDMEFQKFAFKVFRYCDFLRENGFSVQYLHPLDDKISLRAIAMQSGDCIVTRSNMCLFRDGMATSFFMLATSIDNLPFKSENEMLWVEDFCSSCGICIDRCPEDAFDGDGKISRKVCTAHKKGCSVCITICPFYKQGYDKVKRRYDKKCQKKLH